MKAIVILPTYNEKDNIAKMIPVLEDSVFPRIKKWEMAILVADDTSPDGTADVVRNLMKKYKNIHLLSGPKEGLGAAYIRAMDHAITKLGADVVFEMDADFFHDPQKIPEFLEKIDEGYDFVIGTRYSGGGSIPTNWALKRKFYSIVGNLVVRSIFMRFSIHDWTGGYRAIKKEVFLKEKSKLSVFKGYRFQVGFLHKAVQDGFKVAEVPFHATDRTMGRSKMEGAETIIDTLQYVIYARILELKRVIKFLIVGGTGFVVQLLTQELSIRTGLMLLLAGALLGPLAGLGLHEKKDILADALGAGAGAEAAILSNFLFNNFWTFNDTKHIKEQLPFLGRLLSFNLASLGSIVIQFAAIGIADLLLGPTLHILNYSLKTRIVVLFPTIIFLVIPLNYLIYNKLIWKTQYLKKEKK
jgi:dolichol-phosphate mannosyltransferase